VKLLVTGASGLIGRHVIALTAQTEGVELIATSRRRPDGLPDEAAFVAADLSNAADAAAIVRDHAPTHIIHAAWETAHPTYWSDLVNFEWARSAGAMAKAFADVGGKRFVQVGSCAEYDWSHQVCVEGQTPDRPATCYGEAKRSAFELIHAAAQDRFQAVEARIFWVFGPGENPSRLIPLICRSYLAGRVPELGSGRQKRDLLFAQDAASAILMLATTDELQGVVNIASGEEVELSRVAAILAELTGMTETGLGRRADSPGDPERLVASADRIRSTGWRPRYTLRDSLAKTLDWWRNAPAAGRRSASA
jgi:nucleoside-diphosphate-sugar epimerase